MKPPSVWFFVTAATEMRQRSPTPSDGDTGAPAGEEVFCPRVFNLNVELRLLGKKMKRLEIDKWWGNDRTTCSHGQT